jgi:hypothetical protein
LSGLRAGLLAVTSLGMFGLPLVAAPQVPPPTSRGDSLVIGAASLYEVRYGTPQSRDLDEEPPRDWPRQHSTRTAGRLNDLQRAGGPIGQRLAWSSPQSTHAVCGRLYCLAITPAEEMASVFATDARLWVGRRVEIVGAIDDLNKDPRAEPLWAFLSWSITLQDEGGPGDDAPPITSELEALVWSPEALAGERISVKGTFRGANLFDDMPPGSQRKAGDWVLKDGPFFIWVTGRLPRGSGFSLDPSSRSDCRWRLEVSGKVESEGGLIYLKAKEVRLLGLAPEASLDR